MPRGKTLAGAAVFLLGAALAVAIGLLLGQTNVDRDEAAYRARMQPIWPGPAPLPPAAQLHLANSHSDALPIDLDSGLLRHFFRNELEPQVPYLVRFPVRGAQRAPALLLLPGGGYSFRS